LSTHAKLLRSKSPLQSWCIVKSLKLDKLPADWLLLYLQRCHPENNTAAPWQNLFEQADDATSASLSDSELQAVYRARRDRCKFAEILGLI